MIIQRKRTVTIDLTRVVEALLDRFDSPSPDELYVAEEARKLIGSIMEIPNSAHLTPVTIARIDEDVFAAAHKIVEGTADNAAIQAASEELDESTFTNLRRRLMGLRPQTDPSIAREFI